MTKRNWLKTTCLTALVGAIAMPAMSTSAYAQSAVDALRDEIIITATKNKNVENVQDVPLAITAYGSDQLDALKVRDLESLSFASPNVSLDQIGTTRGTANFSIRGLGVNSSIPSIDPTVGVFVDGVYLGYNGGVVFDLFDLDSIELVRGPQGLLFGRNTTGGAVLINTGNPTDEFRAKARIAVESPVDSGRGGWNTFVQGVVSGPLIENQLNGKLGIYYNTDEGYFENILTGNDHGDANTVIVRGALEYFASDALTFLGKLEYFDSSGDGPASQNRGVFDRDSFDFSIDNPGSYTSEATTFSLRSDWDVAFGDGTITNIFGYRDTEGTTDGDIDALPFFGFHSTSETEQDQISNELRYSGRFNNFDLTAGLYYFDQSIAYTEVRDLPPLSPLTFYGGGTQDHTVYGVFGQIDYDVSDQLTLIGGLRYSKEEKDAGITYIRPRTECSVVGGTCPTSGINGLLSAITGGALLESNGFTDSDDWSNVTPKVGFEYKSDDNNLGYGTYTKGFRSGGYNFRITAVAPFEAVVANNGGQFSFDEEEVDSFELGWKHNTEDGRGQLNAALFFTQIEDMQREVNASDPTAGVVQTILNTADADILGLELEGQYAITDNFLILANIGLIDAEYTDVRFDISGDGVVDATDEGLAIPRVPEATYGIGFVHDADLGGHGSLSTRVNFQHRDEFAYTDNNFGYINAKDQLDANFAWNTPHEGLTVSLYGKNLLDEVTAGGDTQIPFGGARSTGTNVPFAANPAAGTFSPLNKGRVIGLELTWTN